MATCGRSRIFKPGCASTKSWAAIQFLIGTRQPPDSAASFERRAIDRASTPVQSARANPLCVDLLLATT